MLSMAVMVWRRLTPHKRTGSFLLQRWHSRYYRTYRSGLTRSSRGFGNGYRSSVLWMARNWISSSAVSQHDQRGDIKCSARSRTHGHSCWIGAMLCSVLRADDVSLTSVSTSAEVCMKCVVGLVTRLQTDPCQSARLQVQCGRCCV